MYQRDDKADANGTYLVVDIDLIPQFLVSTFGAPLEGDGLRVSGEILFSSKSGQVFSVHDYKNTTLWATDEGLPTPEEFWNSSQLEEFSLASKDEYDHQSFLQWLLGEQKKWQQQQ